MTPSLSRRNVTDVAGRLGPVSHQLFSVRHSQSIATGNVSCRTSTASAPVRRPWGRRGPPWDEKRRYSQPLGRILLVQLAKGGRRAGAERTGVGPPSNQHHVARRSWIDSGFELSHSSMCRRRRGNADPILAGAAVHCLQGPEHPGHLRIDLGVGSAHGFQHCPVIGHELTVGIRSAAAMVRPKHAKKSATDLNLMGGILSWASNERFPSPAARDERHRTKRPISSVPPAS